MEIYISPFISSIYHLRLINILVSFRSFGFSAALAVLLASCSTARA